MLPKEREQIRKQTRNGIRRNPFPIRPWRKWETSIIDRLMRRGRKIHLRRQLPDAAWLLVAFWVVGVLATTTAPPTCRCPTPMPPRSSRRFASELGAAVGLPQIRPPATQELRCRLQDGPLSHPPAQSTAVPACQSDNAVLEAQPAPLSFLLHPWWERHREWGDHGGVLATATSLEEKQN
jgi:hypothetical protein